MMSIITPVYNGASFITDNIESILKLEIPYEHIIVDGGSTDGTLDIIKKYPHLILVNQEGKDGMYQAIHQGFVKAKSKYITWVNCDDTVVKGGFEEMYQSISNENIDLIYSDSKLHFTHNDVKQKVKGVRFGKFFMKAGFIPFVQPSSIYTKALYEKVDGLDYMNFRIIGDKDLFTRMANVPNTSFKYLNKVSTIFLKHGNSLGDTNQSLYLQETKKVKQNRMIFHSFFYKVVKTLF